VGLATHVVAKPPSAGLLMRASMIVLHARPPPGAPTRRCFTKDELALMQQQFAARSKQQPPLPWPAFLRWAGLEGAASALTDGLCAAMRRQHGSGPASTSAPAAPGPSVTLAQAIMAKASRQLLGLLCCCRRCCCRRDGCVAPPRNVGGGVERVMRVGGWLLL